MWSFGGCRSAESRSILLIRRRGAAAILLKLIGGPRLRLLATLNIDGEPSSIAGVDPNLSDD